MRLMRESTGEPVTIRSEDPIGAGGEARILAVVSHPSVAAKIYHRPNSTHIRKLSAMLSNPPDNPMVEEEHISIAWPMDRLATLEPESRFVGYLMPRVSNTLPVFQYYNPASRQKSAPLFSYQYLLRAARNLAAAVNALHGRGYVIGDLNESNILVTETALVTLVDTDSFQVPECGSDLVYRCTVGKPEYTPPELHGRSFSDIDRTPQHDVFGLAVLVFQLLMEGTHPFAGAYTGEGEPAPYFDRIAAGEFPHGARRPRYVPSRVAPPFDLLHPTLRSLMLRCFEDGHRDPNVRPDAVTWLNTLQEAENQLQLCSVNNQHHYGKHLDFCPWCHRTALLAGRDPFPSREEVLRGSHVARTPPRDAPSAPDTYSSAGYSALPARSVHSGHPHIQPLRPLRLTLFRIKLPANPWSWSALVFAFAGVIAYVVGSPWESVLCTAVAIVTACVAIAQSAQSGLGGEWLASVCLAASLFTGIGSIAALRALHHPAAMRVVTLLSGARSVAISPDGKSVVTGTNRAEDQRLIGGQVQQWDVHTGELKETLAEYSGSISSVSITPDGHSVAVASYAPMQAGHVDLIDARFSDVRTSLATVTASPPTEALSADGKTIAIGNVQGDIELIDVASRQLRRRASVKGEVLALSFSPDGTRLAVATGSPPGSIVAGELTLISPITGSVLWSVKTHGNAVLSVAVSADGRLIASGGNDSWLRLWNASDGELYQEHEMTTARIGALAFSSDGTQLGISTEPESPSDSQYDVQVWDLHPWRLFKTLVGHRGRITSIAFVPDGKTLVSGALDSTMRLWRIDHR